MRVLERLVAVVVASALLACDRTVEPPSPPDIASPDLAAGVLTSQPAQAIGVNGATLKPIITVGDPLPGQQSNPDREQRVWAPIPDGLGAFASEGGLVVFANHELTSTGVDERFKYARVSRLVLDPQSLGVVRGQYEIDGKTPGALFQRLCSATWVGADQGFGGWFFTGEESTSGDASNPSSGSGEGIQLAVNGNEVRRLPWLGRLAHENYIAVPGFGTRSVLFGTDDTSPDASGALQSELYMYVAGNSGGVFSGNGKLYVFASNQAANVGQLHVGDPITGRFIEIPHPETYSASELQTKVNALGAFKFVRLEDLDYARGGNVGPRPAIYFVDTGNAGGLCGGATCDLAGSIYRLKLNPNDPTTQARLVLLARSNGASSGWASPDNIALSTNSLMVQEDPAYSGFTRSPRIYNFKLQSDGSLGAAKVVVRLLNTPACNEPSGTCWESSGIIDASDWLGAGTWLFDVQAHSLPFSFKNGANTVNVSAEGGQLLYLKLAGS
jgi:hypothetical protein